MNNNTDTEFDLLATTAIYLREEIESNIDQWAGSQFEWIISLPSATKGRFGKRLVESWCASKGHTINPSGDSEADYIINGRRVVIKFSTLWKSEIYKFQQVRDQNYEFLICLGVSPFQAHCWVISKRILIDHVIGHTPQHLGSQGTDTFWISVTPNDPDDWLLECGGSLRLANEILSSLS